MVQNDGLESLRRTEWFFPPGAVDGRNPSLWTPRAVEVMDLLRDVGFFCFWGKFVTSLGSALVEEK